MDAFTSIISWNLFLIAWVNEVILVLRDKKICILSIRDRSHTMFVIDRDSENV